MTFIATGSTIARVLFPLFSTSSADEGVSMAELAATPRHNAIRVGYGFNLIFDSLSGPEYFVIP